MVLSKEATTRESSCTVTMNRTSSTKVRVLTEVQTLTRVTDGRVDHDYVMLIMLVEIRNQLAHFVNKAITCPLIPL
jgi:hypothetical protein